MKKAILYSSAIVVAIVVVGYLNRQHLKRIVSCVFDNNKLSTDDVPEPIVCAYSVEQWAPYLDLQNKKYNVIMFGNSMISRGKWDQLLNREDVGNFGIAGDGIACINKRKTPLASIGAKAWIIEGGINDLQNMGIDSICNQYREIISFIQQHGALAIVTPVFYVSASAGSHLNGREEYKEVNTIVEELNRRLYVLVRETGAEILDMNPQFADDKNILRNEFTTDGIHLSDRAYGLWAGEIVRLLEKHGI